MVDKRVRAVFEETGASKVKATMDNLSKQMDRFSRKIVSPKVDLGDKDALVKLDKFRAQLDKLGAKQVAVQVKVNLNDKAALARLDKLEHHRGRVSLSVDLNDKAARAKLAGLQGGGGGGMVPLLAGAGLGGLLAAPAALAATAGALAFALPFMSRMKVIGKELSGTFNAWSIKVLASTGAMKVFQQGLRVLRTLLGAITPIIKVMTPVISNLINQLRISIVRGGIHDFLVWVTKFAPVALPAIVNLAAAVGRFVFQLVKAVGMQNSIAFINSFGVALGIIAKIMVPMVAAFARFLGFMARIGVLGPAMAVALFAIAGGWIAIRVAALAAGNGMKAALIGTGIGAALVAVGILIEVVMDHWRGLLTGFKVAWAWLQGHKWVVLFFPMIGMIAFLALNWRRFWNLLKVIWGAMRAAWRGLTTFMSSVWKGFTNFVGKAFSALAGFLRKAWGGLLGAWRALTSFLSGVWRGFTNFVGKMWNNVWGFLHRLWNIMGGVFHNIANFLGDRWNGFTKFVGNAWRKVGGFLVNQWHNMGDIWRRVTGAIGHAWDNLCHFVSTAWKRVHDFVVGLWHKIADISKRVWNDVKNAVMNPIKFVVNHIWDPFAGVVDAATSFLHLGRPLPQLHLAAGGRLPGFGGGDRHPALLESGETVVSKEHSQMGFMRAAFEAAGVPGYAAGGTPGHKGGHPPASVLRGRSLAHMNEKNGSILDIIKKLALGATAVVVKPIATGLTDVLMSQPWAKNPGFGHMMAELPKSIFDKLIAFLQGKDDAYNAANSGGGVRGMRNPLRKIHGLRPERIDMGVDYGGSGPLFAIGPGVITNTTNSGWPGGAFIEERLGKGTPYAGKYVYFAENIAPKVRVGQHVDTNTVVGNLRPAFPNSELGWGAGTGGGTMAARLHQQASGDPGGHVSAMGLNFSNLLQALGAPGGIKVTKPVGRVPKGFFSPKDVLGGGANFKAGGMMQNGKSIFAYLLRNLFGGSKIAAAGAIASIWGESNWNPESAGTGGRGLIGWTPPSTLPNSAFTGHPSRDLNAQLRQIINFVHKNGDMGAIFAMKKSRSVLDAANIWGKRVERFGINDVHSAGLKYASTIMRSFDNGGVLPPGLTLAYNGTGRDEYVTKGGGGGITVIVNASAMLGTKREVAAWVSDALTAHEKKGNKVPWAKS